MGTLVHMKPFAHDVYREGYLEDEDFKKMFQYLHIQIHAHDGDKTIDYHLQDGLLYKLDNLGVPNVECN